jgi:hypothetical protein
MVTVQYFAPGVKQEIESSISLVPNQRSSWIKFENDLFIFCLILKDIVDIEEFSNLLKKNTKKITLYCHLKKPDKEYKGNRKIVWRKNNLAISQGGVRLEFNPYVQEQFSSIVYALKNR